MDMSLQATTERVLDQDQIEKAVDQFKEDGYVVLENIIPKPFLQELYTQYMKDLDEKVKRFKMDPVEEGNHGLNRWNMHLPSNETYINPMILTNPHVLPILKKLVGDDLTAFLLASDTPFPGSGFQDTHQDLSRFGITVNIPLVDFRDDNAPLQVWPRTHRKPKWKGVETFDYSDLRPFSYENVLHSKKELKIISETFPSRRVQMPAGSILIRDQRLLHRGTANVSQERRLCLVIWYKSARSNIRQLSIPAPHLFMTNFVAQLAFHMRQKGRGPRRVMANRKLLMLGNFVGRLADELSKTDRDARRCIPQHIWTSLPNETKHVLRYACVEGNPINAPTAKRSITGTVLMMTMIGGVLIWKRVIRRWL